MVLEPTHLNVFHIILMQIYCLTKEAASAYGRMSRDRQIDETYFAVVRGYTDTDGASHHLRVQSCAASQTQRVCHTT